MPNLMILNIEGVGDTLVLGYWGTGRGHPDFLIEPAKFGISISDSQRGTLLEQAGAGLEKIVLGSLRRSPPDQTPILAWPLVCGSVVAERTRAVEFGGAVLRVEVPDAGWKREMQALAPRYLAQFNRYAGQKVERIEFVIRQG
jgi:hypothetical protein